MCVISGSLGAAVAYDITSRPVAAKIVTTESAAPLVIFLGNCPNRVDWAIIVLPGSKRVDILDYKMLRQFPELYEALKQSKPATYTLPDQVCT